MLSHCQTVWMLEVLDVQPSDYLAVHLEAVAGLVADLGIRVISLLAEFACRLFKNDLTRRQANFTPRDEWLWITLVCSF